MSPLVSAVGLAALLADRPPVVLDVRWALTTGPDREAFTAAHIPGALFVDLDADLSDPPGEGGRHPLPDPSRFVAAMQRVGVGVDRTVVAYDDASGVPAARLWWLLRHYGHRDVRLLDGGWSAWAACGAPVETGAGRYVTPGDFDGRPGAMPVLAPGQAAEVARNGVLLDVRTPERFRGEREPIDPVAGHIPGARNVPTAEIVNVDGRFKDRSSLRETFAGLGEGEVGVYCGSGVTAAHTVLGLELVGVEAALYAGSWSGWITDPTRPVATGD